MGHGTTYDNNTFGMPRHMPEKNMQLPYLVADHSAQTNWNTLDSWCGNEHPPPQPNAEYRASSLALYMMSPDGGHTENWNDTEKISMAPAQGWHA